MEVRERIEKLIDRFSEAADEKRESRRFHTLRDLFTRDLTSAGWREMVSSETTDAYYFFTRGIDFSDLAAKPFYKRYPAALWRVFLAIAFRLTPPRRLVFAAATALLAVSVVRSAIGVEEGVLAHLLIASGLLFLLLALELKDKLTLKGDLEIARQIQFGLLPFGPHRRGSFTLETAMRPANTVGGDYFDVIDLGGERIALVMGDVAGKGMPAALLMALLQGSLRTLVTAGLRGGELVGALNTHLNDNIPSNRLVTLFYGELDTGSGSLSYVNAGHNPPFLLRSQGLLERLPPTGAALGVIRTALYETAAVRLEVSDRLCLFTDGATEAFDSKDREFGEERFAAILTSHGSSPAPQLIDALLTGILAFSKPSRPRDDITLMVVDRS